MVENKKSIAVFGSTGSVGRQTLEVAEHFGYRVEALTAASNIKLIEEQIRKFRPKYAAVADKKAAGELAAAVADTDVKIYSGAEGIEALAGESDADILINAIVGMAGLRTTLARIKSGKTLALANKESLVSAGDIAMAAAREYNTDILPVDSEHCAVFQCLKSGKRENLKKIILTCSGGPFFGKKREELSLFRASDALAHPTWNMGGKITIDCATLMNKGFEVIEAAHLFGVSCDNVEVVVHRESIIHSMVEFCDNSVIAQLSLPDMRNCIQYACTYPERAAGLMGELDFAKIASLSFYKPDKETFALLDLAYRAYRRGGVIPAVMNAANEIAVAAFLADRISFNDITETVAGITENYSNEAADSLDAIEAADREARARTAAAIEKLNLRR